MRSAAVVVLGCLVFVLSGCALGERERSFMERNGDSLTFIKWTEEGDDRISGEIRSVYASESFEPIEGGSDFTGSINGDRITIDAQSADLTSQWIGEVEGDRLVVKDTGTGSGGPERVFEAASEEEFEAASEELKKELAAKAEERRKQEQAAAEKQAEEERKEAEAASREQDVQEADARLTDALRNVESLAATLEEDASALEEQFEAHEENAQAVRDDHTEVQEAVSEKDCEATYDLTFPDEQSLRMTVDDFEWSRGSLEDLQDTVQDDRAALEENLKDARAYVDDLKEAVKANRDGSTVPDNDPEDAERDLGRAEEEKAAADKILKEVEKQAPALEAEVADTEKTSKDLYDELETICEGGSSASTDASPDEGSGLASSASDDSPEQQFISEYYAAVADKDWKTTYSLLDSESQARFTEEEWVAKQQARDAASGAAPIQSATIDSTSTTGTGFMADVTLSYEDGTEETLSGIEATSEGEGFRRHLTDEEISILDTY